MLNCTEVNGAYPKGSTHYTKVDGRGGKAAVAMIAVLRSKYIAWHSERAGRTRPVHLVENGPASSVDEAGPVIAMAPPSVSRRHIS